MRISDWSSDVCSSDLSICRTHFHRSARRNGIHRPAWPALLVQTDRIRPAGPGWARSGPGGGCGTSGLDQSCVMFLPREAPELPPRSERRTDVTDRSEEHTSELQSLMRISYAVFCLKQKN